MTLRPMEEYRPAGDTRALPSNRRGHRLFAHMYDWAAPRSEAKGVTAHRRALTSEVSGRVLEVGCGNGLNFPYYPRSVAEVVAVEPEPYLRQRARAAAAGAGVAVPVRVLDGEAEALPVGASTFDSAVVSLVLCCVADPETALRELRRVLRPGGRLYFYEHVRATSARARRAQRWAGPLWSLMAGGCHPARDTASAIAEAGFVIERIHCFDYRPGPALPLALVEPHIIGMARAPEVAPGRAPRRR
jgi:SAM-dependent methyltransferase